MAGVTKTLPTGKTILKDIYLSFFYGAKIGVLGLNGAGKSTLLKIIAGLDKKLPGRSGVLPGLQGGLPFPGAGFGSHQDRATNC